MAKLEDLKKIVDTNLSDMDLSPDAKRMLRGRVEVASKKSHPKYRRFAAPAVLAAACLILMVALPALGKSGGSAPLAGAPQSATASAADAANTAEGGELPGARMLSSAETAEDAGAPALFAAPMEGEDSVKTEAEQASGLESFSLRLLRETVAENTGKNTLVSPLSVALALGMTSNGAQGETRQQFESVLGGSVDALNGEYFSLSRRLQGEPDGPLKLADSIWYRDDGSLSVKQSFLDINAAYYGAGAYPVDFAREESVGKINAWVNEATNEKIPEIIQEIPVDAAMYLINAVSFEAAWWNPYPEYAIQEGTFHGTAGDTAADFMKGEDWYLESSAAQGVYKEFEDGAFAFLALLPKSGTADSYVKETLDTAEWSALFASFEGGLKPVQRANVTLPRFEFDFSVGLKEVLQRMGLKDAFSSGMADLSALGSSTRGNLYIDEVLHKAYLQVDAAGAKAGAATAVAVMARGAAPVLPELVIDRPFVCAIVDTETKLPIFIGVVNQVKKD